MSTHPLSRPGRPSHHRMPAPASPDRTLRAGDPAELLAMVELQLGAPLVDSVALIGHRDRLTAGVTVRIDLPGAGGEAPDPGPLSALLCRLAMTGADGAFGLVVVGSAIAPDPHSRGEDAQGDASGGIETARLLLLLAEEIELVQGGVGLEIEELWVLSGGEAIRVHRDALAGDVRADPPILLAPPDSTLVAAQSVALGVPRLLAQPEVVPTLRATLPRVLSAHRPASLPPKLLEERLEHLVALLAQSAVPPLEGREDAWSMTVCERLCDLIGMAADPVIRDELICAVLSRGQRRAIRPQTMFDVLVFSPQRRPHRDICAGGSWYRALETCERTLREDPGAPRHARTEDQEQAWIAVACALALISWWNWRVATAGSLIDEVVRRHPLDPLAGLLHSMMGTPVLPAWDPRRGAR